MFYMYLATKNRETCTFTAGIEIKIPEEHKISNAQPNQANILHSSTLNKPYIVLLLPVLNFSIL
jgi:hypothetical protein